MAAPVWKTPKGNLGTIQEQEFYELKLECVVPNDLDPNLSYKVIAGSLPPGIVLNEVAGSLNGRPKDLYRFRGVPYDVAEDVTSTFCVRVTNEKTGQIADRTFKLTVTGQDAPTFVTESKELGVIFDGSYAEYQIIAIDVDREPLTYYLVEGSLPPGMSLNKDTGIISGIVIPSPAIEGMSQAGWSTEAGWDVNPWDFASRNVSKRYEFSIAVTDTKDTVSKSYSIYVISKDTLTADNEIIAVNGYYDKIVTADLDQRRIPAITTPSQDLGFVSHDNYYAFKFDAVDFDGDAIGFSLLISENIGFDNETNGFDSTMLDMGDFTLPPGLAISEDTGWLYGTIPSIQSVQKEYEFGIAVFKKNDPVYRSKTIPFKITIVGDLRYVVNWITPTDLGTVTAGAVSELSVEANNAFGKKLVYNLQIGSKSRLPQGLRLTESGLIVGRASFEVTTFDQNQLTFDRTVREVGSLIKEMTLDREFKFTVRASDLDGVISAYKTFKVKVKSDYNRPYESLYLRANPGLDDKELYGQLLFNSDIIPNEFVYRNGDPYFGKQQSLDVLVISGINPSTAAEYIQAMAINHYRKKLLIGKPEIAQALDSDGNVKYEVLYLPITDDGSRSKSIDLRTKIHRSVRIDSIEPNVDSNYFNVASYDKIVYPNSLKSMRAQLKAALGYVDREVLPTWMTSKQVDGRIPYWNPALVVAYLKPGTGEQVKFLINRYFEYDLKDISFEVDRYIWDRNLSDVYDSTNNKYLDSHLVTFDAITKIGADLIVFSFEGNGSSTNFDLTESKSDLDADVYNDASVTFELDYITNKSNVGYVVSGIDADALAEVRFVDNNGNEIVLTDVTNGTYYVDFSDYDDGVITASITLIDLVGNQATGTGDTTTIDTIADIDDDAAVNITLTTTNDTSNVEYTVTGVDVGAVARVTFSDSYSNEQIINGLVNGIYTVNLSNLQDGIVTASIFVSDEAGNTANGTSDTVLFDTTADQITGGALTFTIGSLVDDIVSYEITGIDDDVVNSFITLTDGTDVVTIYNITNGTGTFYVGNFTGDIVTPTISVLDAVGNTKTVAGTDINKAI